MLNIKNLTISHAEKSLFSALSLLVDQGEVVTLTGVSGSGKSTLLNWMIGDLDPNFSAAGELWLNNVRCDTLPIEARHIGLLFQDDLLFPHLSVGQNLAFALPATIRDTKVRRQRVEQTLSNIGLVGFHDRDPATLSGGQRARCCWTSRFPSWTPCCAPSFAPLCSSKLNVKTFPHYWSPMTRPMCRKGVG